jgi:hypothetical protein
MNGLNISLFMIGSLQHDAQTIFFRRIRAAGNPTYAGHLLEQCPPWLAMHPPFMIEEFSRSR